MQRNAYIDNVRVLLIFLVVFGHLIQPFIADSSGMRTLYVWIYFFHMPAFIFISGFYAKGRGDKKYISNLFKKLIMPYLIFQLIYTGYYYIIGGASWEGLFYPQWSLWFLVSLFSWHLLLILFKKLKPQYAILLAVGIGIAIGYISGVGHDFSLSRTFVFFPFFLLGYLVTEKQLMLVKKSFVKGAALFIMAAAAVLIHLFPEFNTGWLLHSSSYADLGVGWTGGLIRLGVYAASLLMSISILAWVPERELKGVTQIGTQTLYVYLLHGFFIQFFRQAEIFAVNNFLDVIGLAAISAGLVYLLSSRAVTAIFQPLIEGRVTILREKLN